MRLHKHIIHIQKHMNNVWNEMVSSTPCLDFFCSFSPWLIKTIWDNFSPALDQPCRLITTLFFLQLYFYDYKQSNAPPSTVMWQPSIRNIILVELFKNIYIGLPTTLEIGLCMTCYIYVDFNVVACKGDWYHIRHLLS